MAIIFYIIGSLAFLYGMFVNLIAKSAIHEIEAYVVMLIAAVFIVGATIVDLLHRLLVAKSQQECGDCDD